MSFGSAVPAGGLHHEPPRPGFAAFESSDGPGALQAARRLLREGNAQGARRWATEVVDLSDDLATWSGAAAVLRRCQPLAPPLPRTLRVAVLGSSTTSQLTALLPLAGARAGLHMEVYECPYGQYRQEVLNPASGLYAFGPDVVVLAMHEGDVDLPPVSLDPEAALEASLAELEALWQVVMLRSGAHVVQFTMALPPEQPLGHLSTKVAGSRSRLLQEFNLRLGERAPPSVSFVDCAALAAAVGTRTWFDAKYWHLAKQAVSPLCIPLLARALGAEVAASAGLSRKCLVLDLDGTLWGGVLGEDGLAGIRLGESAQGEAFSAFQDFVLVLKSKGVVLAVCSKNDESLVREAFLTHPGMRLRLEDISVLSAGWGDKAAQLRVIADQLGLGLDALVLVDDNPVERELTRQLAPQVDVVRLPADPAGYVRALADYPYFATTSLTAEDAGRTEQYRARAAAAVSRAAASSLDEFLHSLAMEATVAQVNAATLERVAQLVGKTNQFNLTSRRRGLPELEQLAADEDVTVLTVRLADRFADHGLVGVLIGRQRGAVFDVDTWLMSCRVIGRTLEDEMLAAAAAHSRARGCSTLRGSYLPTAKNGLVADLYPRLGFARGPDSTEAVQTWICPVDEVRRPPGHIRVRNVPAPPSEEN
jgi:FkbH-like protein